MINPAFVQTMARYNRWQNTSLLDCADSLDDTARRADRGAFFRSIHETLSHLLWGDRIWMSRFADIGKPATGSIAASAGMVAGWDDLKRQRQDFDREIIVWSDSVTPDFLASEMSWHSGAINRQMTKPTATLVTHMFNHQTHHRGQVHAMLTQALGHAYDTDLFILDTETPAP